MYYACIRLCSLPLLPTQTQKNGTNKGQNNASFLLPPHPQIPPSITTLKQIFAALQSRNLHFKSSECCSSQKRNPEFSFSHSTTTPKLIKQNHFATGMFIWSSLGDHSHLFPYISTWKCYTKNPILNWLLLVEQAHTWLQTCKACCGCLETNVVERESSIGAGPMPSQWGQVNYWALGRGKDLNIKDIAGMTRASYSSPDTSTWRVPPVNLAFLNLFVVKCRCYPMGCILHWNQRSGGVNSLMAVTNVTRKLMEQVFWACMMMDTRCPPPREDHTGVRRKIGRGGMGGVGITEMMRQEEVQIGSRSRWIQRQSCLPNLTPFRAQPDFHWSIYTCTSDKNVFDQWFSEGLL